MDEHPLSARKPAVLEKALPRAEPGERDNSALHVISRSRLSGEDGRRNHRVIGGGAVTIGAAQRVDGRADCYAGNARPTPATTPENSYEGIAGRRLAGQLSSPRVIAAA
jgi:hypothetical protein